MSKDKNLIKHDCWTYESSNNQISHYTFRFDTLPDGWFKNVLKQVIWESIAIKKIKLQSIHRYHTNLLKFYDFITEYEFNFVNLETLKNKHIEMFIFHLKQKQVSKSTTSNCLSALKWFIKHGRVMGYEGFPKKEVFSGEEYRMLQIEDTLKTKSIPDNVMKQIELALRKEKNERLKSVIEIGIDTGIRLSECLALTEDSLTFDLTDKSILHVISEKNDSDRFIPVSNRVKRAVHRLIALSEESRKTLKTNCITVYYSNLKKKDIYYTQYTFRVQLKNFIKKHRIVDENGDLYFFTFHGFRHTLGTNMLNKGMSIFEIQEYLGHESLHSTSIYAKLQNPTVDKEYRELGFIGKLIKDESELIIESNIKDVETTQLQAALPDGICAKPIDNQGKLCAKYNMCLLCPKFITTPKHLDIHKSHLERLRTDMSQYMKEEYIGSLEHLEKIEHSLESIIQQLEEMKS